MTHDPNPHHPPKSSTSLRVLSADGAPIAIAWVEDLFARLAAILGSAMATTLAGADPELVKAEWAEALAMFTADEVSRGIASVRLRKFAPNLPEFLHLCRPALDPETAWNEAYDGVRSKRAFARSHPAVYWAATAMVYELRNGTYTLHRKRWEGLMQQQWLRGAWEPLPLRVAHTPAKQTELDGVPKPREEVTAMLLEAGNRARVNAGLPPRETLPEREPLSRYSDAELRDMRRAQKLAEGAAS